MPDEGDKGKAAREAMAKLSGTDLAGFEAQLKTTRMFYTPKDAVAFATSADLTKTMELVRTLLLRAQALGRGRQDQGRGRDRGRLGRDARREEEREAALRRHLHEDGGRREAVSSNLHGLPG